MGARIALTTMEARRAFASYVPPQPSMEDAAPTVDAQPAPDVNSADTRETPAQSELLNRAPEWEGRIAIEEQRTDDGRMFSAGALEWRDPPLPLMYTDTLGPGEHEGAVFVGNITRIYRVGAEIWASGVWDTSTPEGVKARERVASGKMPWVSVDCANITVEIREDKEMPPDVVFGEDQPAMLVVFTHAKILGATMIPHPALEDARLSMVETAAGDESGRAMLAAALGVESVPSIATARRLRVSNPGRWLTEEERSAEAARTLTASIESPNFPDRPRRECFGNPKLTRPTHVYVEQRGKMAGEVKGHIGLWWDTKVSTRPSTHMGAPTWRRITVPRSRLDYQRFANGAVPLADGSVMTSTGVITVGCAHAPRGLTMAEARMFYEQAGAGCADVSVGEDEFGIWIHGAMRSTATWAQVREIMGGDLSGDWREDPDLGELEMVGILGVVQGGFDVPGVCYDNQRGVLVASVGGVLPRRVDRFAVLASELAELRREVATLRAAVKPTLGASRAKLMARTKVLPE